MKGAINIANEQPLQGSCYIHQLVHRNPLSLILSLYDSLQVRNNMKHAGQSNHNQGSDEWEFEDACKSFHHTEVTKIFHIIIIRDRGKWQHSEHVHAIQVILDSFFSINPYTCIWRVRKSSGTGLTWLRNVCMHQKDWAGSGSDIIVSTQTSRIWLLHCKGEIPLIKMNFQVSVNYGSFIQRRRCSTLLC